MNRALMFDISFLLLCHIVQLYGIDVSQRCLFSGDNWEKLCILFSLFLWVGDVHFCMTPESFLFH